MPQLTVTIITRDEAAEIASAVASAAWADEVVVVDSRSTDDTVARARQAGARVEVRDWPGFVAQKNHAASIASHDWILSIDADERVTPQLREQIEAAVARGAFDAYSVNRRSSSHQTSFDTWICDTVAQGNCLISM